MPSDFCKTICPWPNSILSSISYFILYRYDIARALLARRDLEVDVLDFRDRTPLVMAVQYGYSHLVRLMLIAGADPSTGESEQFEVHDVI